MKFKIKQNKNIQPISEAASVTVPTRNARNIANERTAPAPNVNIPNAIAFNQFMQEARKNSLPIDITIPNDFKNQVSLPTAPQDLQVLMETIRTNKARKTRDLDQWGMVDPITTYNVATDECNKSFHAFFGQQIQLANSKEEADSNKQTVMKPSSESIDYNGNNELYESAASLGIGLGAIIGQGVSNGLTFMGMAGASFALSVAPVVGTIMVSADLIGKVGYRLLGDVNNNNKNTNDEVAANMNGPKMAQTATSMPMNYGNVVEAFDNYISDILQASRELISGLSGNLAKTYNTEFADYVLDIQTLSADKVQEYIKENSEAAKKQREQQEKINSIRQTNENNILTRKSLVSNAIVGLIMTSKDQEFSNNAAAAIQYYENNYKKDIANDMWAAIQEGNPKEAVQIYINEVKNKKSTTSQLSSIQYDSNISSLNEAQYSKSGRLQLDLSDYYKQLRNDLAKKLGKVLDEFDPKNMTNYAETKQLMEDIIKGADDAIKERIQIITKASSGSVGSSQNIGLGEKAIQFLAGHPIESSNLTELWTRHLADLKMRMNNRLKIMTDYNNATRALGWTMNMLRRTLPDFFARMLTYRYAYAILSNEGFYSYTTEQAIRDASIYNSPLDPSNPSAGTVGQAYERSARALIINALHNHGNQYVEDNKECLSVDEQGGYTLNNTIRYGSLLYNRLNPRMTTDLKAGAGTAFANLSKNQEGADQLINYIYAQVGTPRSLQALVNRISLPQEMVDAKNIIKQTYDNIIGTIANNAKKNADNDEKAQLIVDSFYVINNVGHETVYNRYVANKKAIDDIIIKINADSSIINSNDNKSKEKIIEDIHTYFNIDSLTIPKNITNSYKESIDSLFANETNNAKNDYYSYILSWYSNEHGFANALTIPDPFVDASTIRRVCNMTQSLLELATTGILGYVVKDDKKDTVLNIEEQLPDIRNTIIKLYDGVILLNTINGVFVGNSVDSSHSKVISSSINHLDQLYDRQIQVFRQLQDSYIKKSNDHYAIENLFILQEKGTGTGYELPIIDSAHIYTNLISTNDISNNIINAFNDASIRYVSVPGSTPIRFADASISDKNIVLNDIYNAIKETRNKGELGNHEVFIDKIKKYCEKQQSHNLGVNTSTK